jgi:hypothetical protein
MRFAILHALRHALVAGGWLGRTGFRPLACILYWWRTPGEWRQNSSVGMMTMTTLPGAGVVFCRQLGGGCGSGEPAVRLRLLLVRAMANKRTDA